MAAEPQSVTFEFMAGVQVFKAPYTTEYTFKLYGASGGGEAPDYEGTEMYPRTDNIGGLGGMTTVVLSLMAGDEIYICTGGAGSPSSAKNEQVFWYNQYAEGGYNGGGSADNGGSAGGGATHIASELIGDGQLANYVNNQDLVIAVAGGGGGSDNASDDLTRTPTTGGTGGGKNGGAGSFWDQTEFISKPSEGGAGGGQSSMEHVCSECSMGFGQGDSAHDGADAGAGGGGWYGGQSGSHAEVSHDAAGGGGSGHIGTDSRIISSYMLAGRADWGNGKVVITYTIPEYTITFDADGGICSLTTVTVTTGSNAWSDVASQLPVKSGSVFEGWELSDGTLIYDKDGYAVGNNGCWSADYPDSSWVGTESITVYARWRDAQAPVVSVTPASTDWCNNVDITYSIADSGDSGLSSLNRYECYMSTSATSLVGGGWMNYSDGLTGNIGTSMNGTYYIFLKQIYDNDGNASQTNGTLVTIAGKTYHRFGPYKFDNAAPTVNVTPNKSEAAIKNLDIVFTADDTGGSELSNSNEYEYYLSSSSTKLQGGEWKSYTEGAGFNIGKTLTGNYYLFVKQVYDNADNVSTTKGTLVTVGSSKYHRFGEYVFDNTNPVISIDRAGCDWCNSTEVTISVSDAHSGLSSSNVYKYYLSTSSSSPSGGSWIPYTPGAAFTIGTGLSGEYYIWVKRVSDVVGNYSHSTENVLLGGVYKFDNINPVINITKDQNAVNSTVQIIITASDEGGSQLSPDNSYEYYLSTSNTSPAGGSWNTYASGTAVNLGEGLTGTYYLFVKRVKDNAGNWSNDAPYVISDGIIFDNAAPVISVNKTGCEACKNLEIIITASDEGTGLSSSNIYEYYLSSSAAALSGGTWISYTSGEASRIGIGLNGTYYLFIRSVYDNAGNISATEGTIINIGSGQYHVFGPYTFDNKAPEGTVTYYENNAMLGLWDSPDSSPYAVMLIDDAADNLSGIERIYLELYDKANPDNKVEFDFIGAAPDYECVFNLYSALAGSEDIETIHMAVWAVDKVGNKGTLPITGYDFGTDGKGDTVTADDIGFKEDDTPGIDDEYERDAFRVEARIINRWGETKFRRGDVAYVEIFTYGYVEYVDAYFNSLTTQINPQYDDEINLLQTAIPVQERYVYTHKFFIPLYAMESLYTDNVVNGYKKDALQSRWLNVPVEGTILDDIKTILKYR